MASAPFLKIVRHLFSRLLFSLQVAPSLAMMIISFWVFVEEHGHVGRGFIESINYLNDYHIQSILSYAEKICVGILHLESSDSNASPFRKEFAEGFRLYLNNVCYEAVSDLLDQFEVKKSVRQTSQAHEDSLEEYVHQKMYMKGFVTIYGESSSQPHKTQGPILRTADEATPLPLSTDILANSPNALSIREKQRYPSVFQHQQDITPNEAKTLFLIFSNGYPFSEDELFDYFLWNYGDIEEIATEEPNLWPDSLCALITFASPDTLLHVLGGEKKAQFIINGKYAWGERYVGQKRPPTSS